MIRWLLILSMLWTTAASAQLTPMLKITWSRGPNLPQGFQDSDGGILGDTLITVGGYCGGGLALDNQKKPGRYPAGFVKKAWGLDPPPPRLQRGRHCPNSPASRGKRSSPHA